MTETTQAPALTWKRTQFSTGGAGYTAQDDTFGYALAKRYCGWYLQVQRLVEIAGIKTPVGQQVVDFLLEDTAKLCKLIAAEYSAFGPKFNEDDHGGKSRMTAAACIIYAREREGTLR